MQLSIDDLFHSTAYASAADLAQAMIRAAEAHGSTRSGLDKPTPTGGWCAEYMAREQADEELPE
jgi:hypothetical protein